MLEELADLLGRAPVYVEARCEEACTMCLTVTARGVREARLETVQGGCLSAWGRARGFASFVAHADAATALEAAVARSGAGEDGRAGPGGVPRPVRSLACQGAPPEIAAGLEEWGEGLRDLLGRLSRPPMVQAEGRLERGWRRLGYVDSAGTRLEALRPASALLITLLCSDGKAFRHLARCLPVPARPQELSPAADELGRMAADLVSTLRAPWYELGRRPVVLHPEVAATLIHEVCGHPAEADEGGMEPGQGLGPSGARVAPEVVTVVDGPGAALAGLCPEAVGAGTPPGDLFPFDDEGTQLRDVLVIDRGRVGSRLCTRSGAAAAGAEPTGNARALDYRFAPLARMTATYLLPGDVAPRDMFSGVAEGVYVRLAPGGETDTRQFAVTPTLAYRIHRGTLAEPVRVGTLGGPWERVLASVQAVAGDFAWRDGATCGKGGQDGLRVAMGAPHVLLARLEELG